MAICIFQPFFFLGILCIALVLTSGQPVYLSPWINCKGPCVNEGNCNFNCNNLGYSKGGFCWSFAFCCCLRDN
ncbi:hypothetical protein VNO78_15872 [Psophocarpus tetragonolobus]|uniref:LCR-like protein n=1 Tax=Psophocarpus tetragonolobus TaxID=3891 RepID=A0AAN9XKA3_PSOTE